MNSCHGGRNCRSNASSRSVSVERMSPDREPERGWLKTIGPVTEMSDGHGLVPIVFLGPSEARGTEMIVRSFLKYLDPDA
jgi:hypothetical protein